MYKSEDNNDDHNDDGNQMYINSNDGDDNNQIYENENEDDDSDDHCMKIKTIATQKQLVNRFKTSINQLKCQSTLFE